MSHKTFIAAIIGFIIVGVIAITLIADTREQGVGTTVEPTTSESVSGTDTGEPAAPAPSTMPQGKINVQVACESALMYTTFTDGAAADAFVAECVLGKHPDVIERYIESLGVDGATI